MAGFIRALQPEYVVETGTCIGQTAELIGMALLANGHGELDTLEVNAAYADVAINRCAGYPVNIYLQSSLSFQPKRRIDFAWFDSLLDLRVPEFEAYRPFMQPNHTIVGFHDTGPHKGKFGEQIRELGQTLQLPTPRGVTFLQVR